MSDRILIKSVLELNKSLNSLKAFVDLTRQDDPIYELISDIHFNFESRYKNHFKTACYLQSEFEELKTQISN